LTTQSQRFSQVVQVRSWNGAKKQRSQPAPAKRLAAGSTDALGTVISDSSKTIHPFQTHFQTRLQAKVSEINTYRKIF